MWVYKPHTHSNSMLRMIGNRIAGRKKTLEDTPDIGKTTEFLGSLNGETRGTIKYSNDPMDFNLISLANVRPKDMVRFVKEKFNRQNGYVDVRHEVYVGASEVKHYFNLEAGNVVGRFGERVVRGRTTDSADISFVVKGARKPKDNMWV